MRTDPPTDKLIPTTKQIMPRAFSINSKEPLTHSNSKLYVEAPKEANLRSSSTPSMYHTQPANRSSFNRIFINEIRETQTSIKIVQANLSELSQSINSSTAQIEKTHHLHLVNLNNNLQAQLNIILSKDIKKLQILVLFCTTVILTVQLIFIILLYYILMK